MGTYYTVGVINNFTASANRELKQEDYENILSERLDLECFDLTLNEDGLNGKLRESIFTENISDLYTVIQSILSENRNGNIDGYFEMFGINIENYQMEYLRPIRFKYKNGLELKLDCQIALLFIEGKVFAEEFYSEPILLNWLFRNSTIENKLVGCIASGIIG